MALTHAAPQPRAPLPGVKALGLQRSAVAATRTDVTVPFGKGLLDSPGASPGGFDSVLADSHRGHDFSRIPVMAPPSGGRWKVPEKPEKPKDTRATSERPAKQDFLERIKEVTLVFLKIPNVKTAPLSENLLQVTLDDFIYAGGFAKLVGGDQCENVVFGFFQIYLAPGSTRYSVLHLNELHKDMKWDFEDSDQPLPDVFRKGDSWTYQEKPKCSERGRSKPVEVLFQDKPSIVFVTPVDPVLFAKALVMHDRFFTTFSVQDPGGGIHHLTSFYWGIDYCESFDKPNPGKALGKSLGRWAEVQKPEIRTTVPNEPGLSLVGRPAVSIANDAIKHPKVTKTEYGELNIICTS